METRVKTQMQKGKEREREKQLQRKKWKRMEVIYTLFRKKSTLTYTRKTQRNIRTKNLFMVERSMNTDEQWHLSQ
jgi:hypothetical protein